MISPAGQLDFCVSSIRDDLEMLHEYKLTHGGPGSKSIKIDERCFGK